MDYNKLSDFEINCEVFEKLYGGAPDYKEGENGAMVLISYEGDIVRGEPVEISVERGKFNPCNNPEDAWPIIVENKFSIYPSGKRWGVEGLNAEAPFYFDNNPLRAAMIVFLMMHDDK